MTCGQSQPISCYTTVKPGDSIIATKTIVEHKKESHLCGSFSVPDHLSTTRILFSAAVAAGALTSRSVNGQRRETENAGTKFLLMIQFIILL